MHSNSTTNLTPAILLVAFLAVVLRLYFFSGYVSGDDEAYIAQAYLYSQGIFLAPENHWAARTVPVVLTSVFYFIFGVNEVTTVMPTLLCSLASVFVSYLVGKELFSANVAVLAAGLTAIFPMEVLFATQLFPYAYLSFFSSLCFYFFIKSQRENSLSLAFTAGIFIGLAYLSRVTALYCFLFILFHILWFRRIDRSHFLVGAGFLAILFLEITLFYFQSGNPLLRFEILSGINDLSGTNSGPRIDFGGYQLKWFLEPFTRPFFEQEFGGFFLFLLPTVVFQLIWGKSKSITILLLWIIPIFIYISYGSTSPFEYSPLRRLPRYLSVIIVPCMVLLAYQIVAFRRAKYRILSILLLIIMSTMCLLIDNSPDVAKRKKLLADYINENANSSYIIPRSLYFDYLFYSGFVPSENAKLFLNDNDHSDALYRIRVTNPKYVLADVDAHACGGAYIVDDQLYISEAVKGIREKVVVYSLKDDNSFYHRIKEHPLFMSVFSLVRDDKRLARLSRSRKDNAYTIYRVDGKCERGS